jgi:phospholipid transport system substrate-binding protein
MENIKMIKKLFSAIVAVALFSSFSVTAKAVDKKNPYAMIETVAKVTFKRFADEQTEIRKTPDILKNIVREELMPYVDYRYAALKVIGVKNYKQTTKQSRADFVTVFREYLVTSYAQVFTLYKQQKVEFEPEKSFNKARVVAVRTSVLDPNRPPIDISFRVRKNKKTLEWKAYDMVAEGVSLLDSKQAELSGLIRQKGLPYVTEMLKTKSDKEIVFK